QPKLFVESLAASLGTTRGPATRPARYAAGTPSRTRVRQAQSTLVRSHGSARRHPYKTTSQRQVSYRTVALHPAARSCAALNSYTPGTDPDRLRRAPGLAEFRSARKMRAIENSPPA